MFDKKDVKDFEGKPVCHPGDGYLNLMDPAWRQWLKDFVTNSSRWREILRETL